MENPNAPENANSQAHTDEEGPLLPANSESKVKALTGVWTIVAVLLLGKILQWLSYSHTYRVM